MEKKPRNPLLRAAKICSVLLFMLVFIVLFVFCVFLPRTTSSDYDTLEEKPSLTFGSLLDGSYTAQWAEYFTDTVFMRDRFKDAYVQLRDWFGKETVENGEVIIGNTDPGEESDDEPFSFPPLTSGDESEPSTDTSTGSEDPSVDTSSEESNTSSDSTKPPKEEICEGILILGTRAMEVYYGDSSLKRIPAFTDTLNHFAELVPDINVYSMVIPKSCAFYMQPSPTYGHLTGRTLNDLNAIDERLSDKVKSVNVYDALSAHVKEDIYMRTDHHWSSLGAYYAAQRFASDAGLPFRDLSAYQKNVREGYIGTMYKYSGYNSIIRDNPEPFVTYVPQVTYQTTYYNTKFENPRRQDSMFAYYSDDHKSSWYETFIGGDGHEVHIHSDAVSNGRKLLVVKDSYGNALIPFLLYSFEDIYVVDARNFELGLKNFATEHGITDILFAECTFSAQGNSYIANLRGICK